VLYEVFPAFVRNNPEGGGTIQLTAVVGLLGPLGVGREGCQFAYRFSDLYLPWTGSTFYPHLGLTRVGQSGLLPGEYTIVYTNALRRGGPTAEVRRTFVVSAPQQAITTPVPIGNGPFNIVLVLACAFLAATAIRPRLSASNVARSRSNPQDTR
jgi:hypothetical protein